MRIAWISIESKLKHETSFTVVLEKHSVDGRDGTRCAGPARPRRQPLLLRPSYINTHGKRGSDVSQRACKITRASAKGISKRLHGSPWYPEHVI